MLRDLNLATTTDTEACPETRAMRPNTGLTILERAEASALVKQLMRAKLDRLPDGVTLTEADKAEVYAEAARILSSTLGRLVTPEQIKLVAATIRTRNTPRKRYTAKVSQQHHAILKADAEAEGVSVTALMRRILDRHYELPAEG